MTKTQLLVKLRENVEGSEEHQDGSRWGEVYLPNVGTGHQFAGLLSALKQEGLYKQIDKVFGSVKL